MADYESKTISRVEKLTAGIGTISKITYNVQTARYVNGTTTTLDGMKTKVESITDRMLEVDSNLNYLLGRLSLVTQEFGQIKTGLGEALEKAKSSFQDVKTKLEDSGPGPHVAATI